MNGLKFVRTKILNITLQELADVLGISKQAIYQWENGQRKIPKTRLEQLVTLGGWSDELLLTKEVSEADQLKIEICYLEKRLADLKNIK